ncbi:hypothetical protein MJM95_29520, partial [Salmonella enterica subsp. enterica serovar Anatum]|nr:hypothetical protein [Salmonella enterica subsp. enterica serovar Anatum]
ISIDGPQVVHDNYRRTPSGRASFSRVVNAIRLLQANDVEFNTAPPAGRDEVKPKKGSSKDSKTEERTGPFYIKSPDGSAASELH